MSVSRNEHDVEVVVVGAGPTGLMAACELVRRGISCRIIEKRPDRSRISKALAVHARTMELMDMMGISAPFITRGYTAPGLNATFSSDTHEPVSIDLHRLDTNFPYILILPQGETEEILEDHLSSFGVTVERNVRLRDFHEQDGIIYSTVEGKENGTSTIRSRYLIGCDGAHSTVRHQLDLPFIGDKYEVTAFLADVKIEGNYTKGHIENYSSPRGIALCLPFRDEYVRIIAIDFTKQHRTETNELELSELQETVDAIVPKGWKLKETRWITRFGTDHRQTSHYSIGNVYLAGDAAHVHAPAGGQGMNTGLQDAANLAWKIALDLKGRAPQGLLDSYNHERHQIGYEVLRFTDLFLKNFLIRNPIVKKVRNAVARTVLPTAKVQNKIGERLSGIGINYRFTDLSKQLYNGKLTSRSLQSGDRMPDLELKGDELPVRMYRLLQQPWYQLFFFVSVKQLSTDQHVEHFFRKMKELESKTVQMHVILDEGVPGSIDTTIPTLIDFKKEFERKTGAEHGSIMLIRPDGYLAFHQLGLNEDELINSLKKWVSF